MPTSRDLKSEDFCHTDNTPPPPCTINYIPPAVSPLNPSSPPKKRTHSHSTCVFWGNPRCINALRNCETENCFSVESLPNGVKSLKYRKIQSVFFFFFSGDLVTPMGDQKIRSSCRRLPDNIQKSWHDRGGVL